jgi:hypothetical protein
MGRRAVHVLLLGVDHKLRDNRTSVQVVGVFDNQEHADEWRVLRLSVGPQQAEFV